MREILFRGKRKDNGKWVYGYLAEIETAWDRYEYGSLPTEYEKVIIRTDLLTREPVTIITETVGQWTGLTDKNGVKIFEGDFINDIDYGIMICVYLHGSFVFQSIKNNMFWIDLQRYVPVIEVIGSIHDNPAKGDTE
ncbi:YopX family protein [Anaerotignum sp.]|uniref:YopX family protein n=1 Tax=Anaerotignum sp. TaxID=2039241 RepID=UPI002714B18A|nr:YopX family protein [Anaerotignum sp.]